MEEDEDEDEEDDDEEEEEEEKKPAPVCPPPSTLPLRPGLYYDLLPVLTGWHDWRQEPRFGRFGNSICGSCAVHEAYPIDEVLHMAFAVPTDPAQG